SGSGGAGAGAGGAVGGGAGGDSTGAGGGTSCTNVSACGGSVVGTWNVTSSCLQVSGSLAVSMAGAGCPSAPITGSLTVTGTFTANADGTYSDGTITSGTEQFTLQPSCLIISSTQ